MKSLKSLEIIKNASTIYVGCASDIYTRYSFECNEIEKSLKALKIITKFIVIEDYTEEYLGSISIPKSILDDEEIDLLKEVFNEIA